MKYKINILILLFMICSCDNHDFELRYKEQALYIHNMLHISIEPLNNLDKAYSYLVFLRQHKPYDTIDTIHLEKDYQTRLELLRHHLMIVQACIEVTYTI